MVAPCKNCKDRYVGCHSKCEKYKEYAAECEVIREKRRKESDERMFFGETLKVIAKRHIKNR